MNRDLTYFIEQVSLLKSFWKTNYYMRCMKKQPHGGVGHVFWPNYYLRHKPADTFWLFCNYNREIPRFFQEFVDDELSLWKECSVDLEELLKLCFDDDNFWYVGFRVLKEKREKKKDYPLLWDVVDKSYKFEDYFDLDNLEEILYAFGCYLMKEKMLTISSIEEIEKNECLLEGHNKYGLNLVSNIEFCRQGFILGDKYYLYNLFLDTSIGNFGSEVPYTIEIWQKVPNARIFMRCDNTIAVSAKNFVNTASMDFQKFRGISLALTDIVSLVTGKELVVHYNPESLNKLLLVIKKDKEIDGTMCFHIEVEELWNPEKIRDDIIAVNYIHAKYISEIGCFNHIDFSVNQYKPEVFRLKYNDAVNDNKVTIDKYADRHYKVWCIESEVIEVEIWSSLVSATLDEPFRELFCEMFPRERKTEVYN